MVKIRLRRMGSHKRPFYKIVVADSRSPRDGKFIEELGTYNPLLSENNFKLNLEKAKSWLKNGAQPTETVRSIMNKANNFVEKNINLPVDSASV